ncbi:MAG: transglutaminase domain-containing protein [Syntrophomonadaceae bacterium]|nr:transglutaminase domain-containing protein [Syntrophomonadaceae bacterium]
MKKLKKLLAMVLTVALIAGIGIAEVWAADYRVSFSNSEISITSPSANQVQCNGVVSIRGTSKLSTVYFAVRGPNQELAGYQAEVVNGAFALDINLRYGKGTYTIWAGSHPQKFDGSIRFLVENIEKQDNRNTAPSYYVDSDNPVIQEFAKTLAPSGLSDMEKLRNIHKWVTTNIKYDCRYHESGRENLEKASYILKKGDGVCSHYAILTAALCRAAGLPARIINGPASPSDSTPPVNHAWNEVLINGQWVPVDTCWDAGYTKDNAFVPAQSTRFLAPSKAVFAKTHTASVVTLH